MTTLRSQTIEAMARAWVEYEGDEWDDINNPGMRAIKAAVERELDALLDFLTEHASQLPTGHTEHVVAALRETE